MRKLIFAIMFLAVQSLQGQEVIGTWQTLDDDTGERTSNIVIEEVNGELRGYIDVILDGEVNICTKCKGDKKDQSYEGLEIVWGFKRDGSGWTNGEILDPRNGKVYRCQLTLRDANTLDIRGYIGSPLFGRTQTWKRKL